MNGARDRQRLKEGRGRAAVRVAAPDETVRNTEPQEALTVTLTALQHWAKSAGVSWFRALAEADADYSHDRWMVADERRREAEEVDER